MASFVTKRLLIRYFGTNLSTAHLKSFLTLLVLLLILTGSLKAQSIADTLLLKEHLTRLIDTEAPRKYTNIEVLNDVAAYINEIFEEYGDTTYYQSYEAYDQEYKNVICVFGKDNEETIVVGAHYDVCGDQDGADDNASGVAGLLELARLLKGQELKYRIELVAYTLEEPPFFRSLLMGSHVHAKSLYDQKREVYGMFCLEMIGYYDDSKGSQDYPLGFLKLFYGKRGDYITLVNKMNKEKFARRFSKKFKGSDIIKTKKFTGPKGLEGVDFSDHLNYWKYGYSALMITDTAFYRNKNYHQTTDTMETLDLERMGKVVDATLTALLNIK